jgi:APA family basic amino acid/polyamine antiporter
MGIHRQVPDRLRQLHPKFGTPWMGIIIFSAISALTLIPGQATFLGNLYAFGAMLSFTIAHLSVTRLRFSRADVERPYRPPGNLQVRGVDLPLFAIVGGTCTFASLIVLAVLHTSVSIAGIGWLVVGLVIYPIYRRRQGLDLTTTTQVELPKPVIEQEAEYGSLLVAFDVDGYVPEVMATAARMAARRRRGIYVLVTIPVPASAPIDASMPDQESRAQSVLEEAGLQAGSRRVTTGWRKVRAGQTGRLIVDTAKSMHAGAIVMPMPESGGFGRTLETVLRERPCRVIIESIPDRPREPEPVAT